MLNIGIIVGSTRPGRNGAAVARWVLEQAQKRGDAHYTLIDLADFHLPMLDEPLPAAMGQYSKTHTQRWSAAITPQDAFVFVTPEYNHSISGALKNAIDFLSAEWADKAAGFVAYGSTGGTRAVEHLRQIAGQLKIADVREQVALSLFEDFRNMAEFTPRDLHLASLDTMLDQLLRWGAALKTVRSEQLQKAA